MAELTAGSNLIVKVLLDKTDDRPVWLQAWGGTNTIARAVAVSRDELHQDSFRSLFQGELRLRKPVPRWQRPVSGVP